MLQQQTQSSTGGGRRSMNSSSGQDRMAYGFSMTLGSRVRVKLRSQNSYEAIFGGMSSDGNCLLKHARQVGADHVQEELIIPQKDIQSCTTLDSSVAADASVAFKTDAEIRTTAKAGAATNGRELERWQPADGGSADGAGDASMESLEAQAPSSSARAWDQFQVNREKFGVNSTYSEDLYTTPLDTTKLSRDQQTRAERIAREIEVGGRSFAANEEGGDGDEEAKFSAVIGTGGYSNKAQPAVALPPPGKNAWVPPSRRPATEQQQGSGPAWRGNLNSLNLEPASASVSATTSSNSVANAGSKGPKQPPAAPAGAAPRGSAGSVPGGAAMLSTSPVLSEMKGINALNLEPAQRRAPTSAAGTTPSNAGSMAARGVQDMKKDFEASLQEINCRQSSLTRRSQNSPPPSSSVAAGASSSAVQSDTTGGAEKRGNFQFNPHAGVFTPGGASGSQTTLNIAITPGGSLSGTLKGASAYEEPAPAAASGGPAPQPPAQTPQVVPPPPVQAAMMHHMAGGYGGMMMHHHGAMMHGMAPMMHVTFVPLCDADDLEAVSVTEMMTGLVSQQAATGSPGSTSWSGGAHSGYSFMDLLHMAPPMPHMAAPMYAHHGPPHMHHGGGHPFMYGLPGMGMAPPAMIFPHHGAPMYAGYAPTGGFAAMPPPHPSMRSPPMAPPPPTGGGATGAGGVGTRVMAMPGGGGQYYGSAPGRRGGEGAGAVPAPTSSSGGGGAVSH
jgi:hypothetical protein